MGITGCVKHLSANIWQISLIPLPLSLQVHPAGYTSGNGLYCSRQLLWDIAVTPAPIITVGAFQNQTNCSAWLSNQQKEEEEDWNTNSAVERQAKCSVKQRRANCAQWRIHSVTWMWLDTFWSPFTGGNSNFNYNSARLPFMCIVWRKGGLHSNMYVVTRSFQFADILQLYHLSFCSGNRNGTFQEHVSCRLR